MKLNLEGLRAQLEDFGLNPMEWAIVASSRIGDLTRFEIRSFNDGHTLFEGWANQNRWISLGLSET